MGPGILGLGFRHRAALASTAFLARSQMAGGGVQLRPLYTSCACSMEGKGGARTEDVTQQPKLRHCPGLAGTKTRSDIRPNIPPAIQHERQAGPYVLRRGLKSARGGDYKHSSTARIPQQDIRLLSSSSVPPQAVSTSSSRSTQHDATRHHHGLQPPRKMLHCRRQA